MSPPSTSWLAQTKTWPPGTEAGMTHRELGQLIRGSITLFLRRAAHHFPALDALALEHLGGEHVAARVDRDVVHAEELPRHAAEAAIAADHFAVGAPHHAHLVVAA